MLHCFCVCFIALWLRSLLLRSICHKQTCFPLRCNESQIICICVSHLTGAFLSHSDCQCPRSSASCLPHCYICCSLCRLPPHSRIVPLLSGLWVFYLSPNMLPHYEEAIHLLRLPLLSNDLFSNLVSHVVERFFMKTNVEVTFATCLQTDI